MEQLFEALSSKIYEKYKTNISEQYQEFEDLSGYVATQFSRKDPSPSYSEYQKEVLKQGWEHFQKKILEKGHNTNIMNFVDSYDQFRGGQTSALKGMYQHTGYGQERQEMKSLTVYVDKDMTSDFTYSATLIEPLIIDKLCNIYLDNVILFNGQEKDSHSFFILDIDQFKIDNTFAFEGADNTMNANNKIIIPNDIAGGKTGESNVLKSKKFNYIGQINPTKLTNISGSITSVAEGTTTAVSAFSGAGTLTMEFLFIAAEKMPWK